MNLKDNIETLKELGFNISSKGFIYWLYALEIYKKEKQDMKSIYKKISKKEKTSCKNIELLMHYTWKPNELILKNHFNYSEKLTNKKIMLLITNFK